MSQEQAIRDICDIVESILYSEDLEGNEMRYDKIKKIASSAGVEILDHWDRPEYKDRMGEVVE